MSYVVTEIHDQIGEITVNRPEAMNALNADVLTELEGAFETLITSDQTGVILFTGAGDRAFIAGADIKAMAAMGQTEAREFSRRGQRLTETIESSPKPVIAAVNGFALGGGCELALACHIRVASRNAQFAQPEVHLGIIPGWGGTQRLPRLIGIGRATEWIITGEMTSAEEAHVMGLVNEVVEPDQLMTRARKMAQSILKNGPQAIRTALQCIRSGYHLSLQEGLDMEAEAFMSLFETPEGKEGLRAFIEKRAPRFRD